MSYKDLNATFWTKNDLNGVKKSLNYLLHDEGDFIKRIYDVINNDSQYRIHHFGESIPLELYGTVHPDVCPPMNFGTTKVLRALGFNVSWKGKG